MKKNNSLRLRWLLFFVLLTPVISAADCWEGVYCRYNILPAPVIPMFLVSVGLLIGFLNSSNTFLFLWVSIIKLLLGYLVFVISSPKKIFLWMLSVTIIWSSFTYFSYRILDEGVRVSDKNSSLQTIVKNGVAVIFR